MSLKLGNTNIAGTQVLYSTTGNNTDGAMTQAITTTSLNLKANDADVVHKTGDETISGLKTFTNFIKETRPNLIKGNNPTTNTYLGLIYDDGNHDSNNRFGLFETEVKTNGEVTSYITAYKNIAGVNTNSRIAIAYPLSGEPYTIAPASDVIDSIVTTTGINKSSNGYVKLGNGIIIQWGRSSQRTFTYPIPFSSDTSFSIVVNNQAGTNGYGRPDSVDSLTRTSCMVSSLAEYPVRWIAIGY